MHNVYTEISRQVAITPSQGQIIQAFRSASNNSFKRWTGSYWQDFTLHQIDASYSYQVGHTGGRCPYPTKAHEMVVIHTNGIHKIAICYCNCIQGGGVPARSQLLRNGWYPATITEPSTCATFGVLKLFHFLTLVGALNVHDFIGSLERLTDATRLQSVPVRLFSLASL